ncbi:hypothetical protein K7W03_23465 [Sphingobium sp. PNB]|uniref:hypothetical protein n=1 Tax=Sphingobium sp. PNB TaxID=863934 RepID=UPI001CA3AD49|nr:hypothetical protein [Sphingobium sp. PNB]MCB4862554.1 hypothetical protein [Sphingobium sp. PNB]
METQTALYLVSTIGTFTTLTAIVQTIRAAYWEGIADLYDREGCQAMLLHYHERERADAAEAALAKIEAGLAANAAIEVAPAARIDPITHIDSSRIRFPDGTTLEDWRDGSKVVNSKDCPDFDASKLKPIAHNGIDDEDHVADAPKITDGSISSDKIAPKPSPRKRARKGAGKKGE